MKKVQHTSFLPTKFGNPSKTNFVHHYADGTKEFWSYETLIAVYGPDGTLKLSTAWNASATTNEYRIRFTGLNTAATRKAIATGEIEVLSKSNLAQWAWEV
jgi:hypothetical protein